VSCLCKKTFYSKYCIGLSDGSTQNHRNMAGTTNLQKKMCRVSARRLSIYNFACLQESNLLAESQILKKNYWNTKSFNQNKKFRTLKVERGQKYARTEFAGSTQNPKKIMRTSNQPIRTKFFPKKLCLVP
jgi:hypothetical protein